MSALRWFSNWQSSSSDAPTGVSKLLSEQPSLVKSLVSLSLDDNSVSRCTTLADNSIDEQHSASSLHVDLSSVSLKKVKKRRKKRKPLLESPPTEHDEGYSISCTTSLLLSSINSTDVEPESDIDTLSDIGETLFPEKISPQATLLTEPTDIPSTLTFCVSSTTTTPTTDNSSYYAEVDTFLISSRGKQILSTVEWQTWLKDRHDPIKSPIAGANLLALFPPEITEEFGFHVYL